MSGVHSRHRRHRRFIVNLSTDSEGTWLRDISMRGMRVLSRFALRIDEPVETGLETDLGELHLKGRVVRACRSGAEALPYEYGIELDALDSENDLRLRRYLDSLSAEAVVAPENPVDPLDLQRLHDRIEELERALKQRASRLSEAAEEVAPSPPACSDGSTPKETEHATDTATNPPSDQATDPLQTHFEFARFAHLIKLGQPLIPLLRDCASLAEDGDAKAVAELFSPCFDLASILRHIDVSFDEETVLRLLFGFYEQNLIDFA